MDNTRQSQRITFLSLEDGNFCVLFWFGRHCHDQEQSDDNQNTRIYIRILTRTGASTYKLLLYTVVERTVRCE